VDFDLVTAIRNWIWSQWEYRWSM